MESSAPGKMEDLPSGPSRKYLESFSIKLNWCERRKSQPSIHSNGGKTLSQMRKGVCKNEYYPRIEDGQKFPPMNAMTN